MALNEVVDLVFDQFKGVDYRTNPLKLNPGMLSGNTAVRSSDCRNCIGHGEELWKRPGLKRWGTAYTALVSDIAGWRPAVIGAPNEAIFIHLAYGLPSAFLPQSINDYSKAYRGLIPPFGPSAWAAVATTNVGYSYRSEMEVCDDLVWRTSGIASGYARTIKNVAGVYTEAAASAAPVGYYGSATWHKRVLWHFRNGSSSLLPATFEFSDVDAPETYPAANIDKLDPKGSMSGLRGMHSMGEHAYIGGLDRTYLLTGASVSDFKIQQLGTTMGMVGKRSWVRVKDLAVGFTCRRVVSDRPDIDVTAYRVTGIGAFNGASPVDKIGDRVKPIIDALNPTAYGCMEYTRACPWGAEDYALFLANCYQWSVTGNSVMLVLDTEDGNWWYWTPAQASNSYRISAMAEVAGLPLLASTSGYLITPDWDYPTDDGSYDFEAYWSWSNPDPTKRVSIERVNVMGNQSTGGPWRLKIAVNGQSWPQAYTREFQPCPYGINLPVPGAVKAANDVKVAIFYGAASTRAWIRRIVIGQKGLERVAQVGE